MTYDEAIEVGDVVFDEYLPKVSAKQRKVFLDALFSELEERGSLEIEDEVVPYDTDAEDELDDSGV